MSIWLQLLILAVLLSVIYVIIMENRNPLKTIAWVLVLIFVPILGLLLYIVFGMDNRHKRLITDEKHAQLKKHTLENYPEQLEKDSLGKYDNLSHILYSTNQAFVLKGNSVEPFTNFDEMFASQLKDIENAKQSIHMMYFKFEEDPIGTRMADLLIQKAHEGVKVRFMYDDVANFTVRRGFYKKMAAEGIEVYPFARVYIPFLTSNTNYRNHRKMVIVDGKIGYLGGMNIAERYSIGIRGGIYRDTHMKIQGPAVSELQTAFLVDWQFASGKFVNDKELYPVLPPAGDITMQIATSGPMDKWDNIKNAFVEMISKSRKYIYIQSPYLLPTESVLMAIQNAALAGVDVRIMIPTHGDKGILPPLASRSYVKAMLKAGARVFFYDNGYLHSKAIVSDDELLTIGSTNIDFRSFEQNFEVNGFIYNRELACQMKRTFLDDAQYCREITMDNWSKRTMWEKFKESFARLFSPLL